MNTDTLLRSIGTTLRPVRAGSAWLAVNRKVFRDVPDCIHVTSPGFAIGQDMPVRYTTDGAGVSPPLRWEGLPAGTRSVMLLVEDPDIPSLRPFVHALALGIAPERTGLDEGELPPRLRVPPAAGMLMGRNGLGTPGWVPPFPPPGHGAHFYAFEVFALASDPRFDWPPGRSFALARVWRDVIGRGTLFMPYERG